MSERFYVSKQPLVFTTCSLLFPICKYGNLVLECVHIYSIYKSKGALKKITISQKMSALDCKVFAKIYFFKLIQQTMTLWEYFMAVLQGGTAARCLTLHGNKIWSCLWELQFSPRAQKHAGQVNWKLNSMTFVSLHVGCFSSESLNAVVGSCINLNKYKGIQQMDRSCVLKKVK